MSTIDAFTSEQLAYWFFRLNGCLTITNFILHSEDKGSSSQRTDTDILAVRFPHRKELLMSGNHMRDHEMFDGENKRIDLIIAEVKTGMCRLNGPWTDPERMNINRVLYAIGAFREDEVNDVAQSLYKRGCYQDDYYRTRLVAIGKIVNPELEGKAIQLTWQEVTKFIHERFRRYSNIKSQHEQWDCCGRSLYDYAVNKGKNYEDFEHIVFQMIGLGHVEN